MKRIVAIVFLVMSCCIATLGQTPQFHSASKGVKIKYHNGVVWKETPSTFSPLSMKDVFYLNERDSVSIICGKFFYSYHSYVKAKINVRQIIEQRKRSVWSSVWNAIDANTKTNSNGARYGASSAGSRTMSAECAEKDCAYQVLSFFKASKDERRELSDTSIVLEKRFVSPDVFYFRLYNKTQRDYYIYILQNDDSGTGVTFNQRWTSDDGEVCLVFCLPASSYFDINDFMMFEDNKTQYVPIAVKNKLNIKLLQEILHEETETKITKQLLRIGTCVQ